MSMNLQLSDKNLQNLSQAGIRTVNYDRLSIIEATKNAPTWLHFGAGNIFRAFLARVSQELIEDGYDKGIIVAEGYDYEIIDMAFTPYDDLFVLVTLGADGTADKQLVASITESIKAKINAEGEQSGFERLREIFRCKSLQVVSFTITEKGYLLQNAAKETPPDILRDYENGPSAPRSYMGRIAALLHERYTSGCSPVALVSMDNCSNNGDLLKAAVEAFAWEWEERHLAEPGFVEYLNHSGKVTFPCTMIDKITPAPHKDVKKMLDEAGLTAMDVIVTSKNSHAAPFVNAEAAEYLVIEDEFPNGCPPLEKAGIIFADREVVAKFEKMKVCTCLNPLHTALAIFGCLLGFTKISEEMKDGDLKRLAEIIGYDEGLPVAADPGIINPRDFLKEVIEVRLPNPFLPDTPQRIASDTSQKLKIRFGETIKEYVNRKDLTVNSLRLIPLTFAAWLRYLLGIDDEGNNMQISPDPLHLSLNSHMRHIKFGGLNEDYRERLRPIIGDENIFGINLYEAGIGGRVEEMFAELSAGAGAVRATLQKYLGD